MVQNFTDNKELLHTYQETDIDLRVRQTRIGTLLAIILVPAGSSLEYFIYPEHLGNFFIIRLLCDAILIPIYILLFKPVGRRYIHSLSALWAASPAIAIAVMIYLSEGSTSPYYAGLNLMIIVTCQLLPYTLKESISYCVSVLFYYVIACLAHDLTPFNANIFYNNVYFIVLTSIISVTAGYYYNLRRIQDFRLNHELDIRNKELEELDRIKSQFFANISHELRTPLTLILAPIQDLVQNPDTLNHSVRNLLSTARDNTLRLLKLVNDLLDVIKLEEGRTKLHPEPIDINAFLAATVDSTRHLADSHKIKLNKQLSPAPLIIHADAYSLERIFLNLLSNAIKFTPQGGSITIASKQDEDKVAIDITDTGIGIDENELPYIFDRFHQVDSSSTRKYQGTGLGLALVKELTEKMEGRIIAMSKPEIGTTMQVSFPLSNDQIISDESTKIKERKEIKSLIQEYNTSLPTDPQDDTTEIVADKPGDRSTVLVVDDEPDMRHYLVSILKENHHVLEARNGRQGLELARKYLPQLMLLDLMLPEIDGLEVCNQLKHDDKTKGIKIMLLTARVDEEAKIKALDHGADDFLTKPFSKTEVQTRLHNLLETAMLEQNLRDQNDELKQTLTELKQTQTKLIHSEKLNAIGSLTAGLLHEINNPLNYSITALQMAKMDPSVKSNEDLNEVFTDINEGMQRIRTIITDLQAFAHPSEADKQKPFQFIHAVESALRFTANERNDVDIVQKLTKDDEVIGSQGHIVQVLINLLTNSFRAIEAVEDGRGGEIVIQTECRNGKLCISFRDNGIGMKPDVLSHIFDPFYTTRDVGEGMGLGLSVSHTIIQNHGSSLEAKSEYSKGSEFNFDLPISS